MMNLNSLETAVLTAEIKPFVTQAYVKNVYQTGAKTLVLKLSKPGYPAFELWLVAGSVVFFVQKSLPKPSKPSQQALILRKNITGLKIADLRQRGFERIVEIFFEKKGFSLIVELMPPGNIMLLRDGVIEWALETVETASRMIKKGVEYKPPDERFSLHLGRQLDDVFKYLNQSSPIVSSIARDLGLGGKYAEELLFRANVEKKTKTSELSDDQKHIIQDVLEDLVDEFRSPKPAVYYVGPECLPSVVELKSLSSVSHHSMASFNEGVAEAFFHNLAEREREEKISEMEAEIKLLEKQKSNRMYVLENLEKKREELELFIGKIQSVTYLLENFWTNPEENASAIASITGCTTHLKQKLLLIQMGKKQFLLRQGGSAHRELGKLFDELKKIKQSIAKLVEEINELSSKIDDAKKGMQYVPLTKVVVKPHAARQKKLFREFVTSGGFKVLSGKDAESNIILLRKHLSEDDVVLHADIAGSPVSLLKNGEKASDKDIEEAAQITACYSRAWREMFTNISVYHVSAKQVSFTPPSGGYLPRGSFMIYGKKTYVTSELRLAVLQGEDGRLSILPYLTASRSNRIAVELRPGKTKAMEAAAKVCELLKVTASKEDIESLASKIPFGMCSIFFQDKLVPSRPPP